MDTSPMPGFFRARSDSPPPPDHTAGNDGASHPPASHSARNQQGRRRYGPRTCRICLEVVQPSFPDSLRSTFLGSDPTPTYESEDAELGRLISPCKCKGSQKYVHRGCLQAWREAAPMRDRNFFECPTCRFRYRLERISWAGRLTGGAAQLVLTLVLVFVLVFILGFVGDTIFDLWLEPYDTITGTFSRSDRADYPDDEAGGWLQHFLKGFVSLGIVGLTKVWWAMSPWNWYNLRSTGILGSRRVGSRGRARMEDVGLTVVIIGAVTAIYTLWKGVRFVSKRTLLAASINVLDVGTDDDDEGQDVDGHEHAD